MLFGRGDTSKLTPEERATLEQLRRMQETGHIVILEAEKTAVLLRMVDSYSRWESVFELGRSIRNTALLIAGLLAVWWATEGAITDFIRSRIESQ